jgi:predicted RNA-binding Zn-ribbon protein involved in translation (DUF1610 family)
VTDNIPPVWQVNAAGIRPWINFALICVLIGSLGLGWVLKSALLILGLVVLLPIMAIGGFVFWSKMNIVQASCPVCDQELTGFKGTELDCPSCGEALRVERGFVARVAPPNTIDVSAVEINTP